MDEKPESKSLVIIPDAWEAPADPAQAEARTRRKGDKPPHTIRITIPPKP